MNTKIFLLLTILNGIVVFTSLGQLSETYFYDQEAKDGRVEDYIKGNDYLVVAGSVFDNYPNQASIIKIDTSGNVIWSTTNTDTTSYQGGYVHKIFESEGYIYALAVFNQIKEIWKINTRNGSLEWKRTFYPEYSGQARHFMDYDSNKFLIAYRETSGKIKYTFIDKQNGETLSSHQIGYNSNAKFGIAIDKNFDIYYSFRDTIFKASGINPDIIYWKKALPDSLNIVDLLNIYIDKNDSIYLFARHHHFYDSNGYGKVIALNSFNGSVMWASNAPGAEIRDVTFKDKNGYIYSSWHHAFTGGGVFKFWTSKIDKITGEIEWNSFHSFKTVGFDDYVHSGRTQGAHSLEVDDSGNIFLTGYYGAANYGPECWGILKLDGISGNTIYEKTISEDSTVYDIHSVGLGVLIFDNKPYFIGELQADPRNRKEISRPTLVKLDSESGDVLLKKYLLGVGKMPSKAVQIKKYGKDKTIVLKQRGQSVELEIFGSDHKTLWRKSFYRGYVLLANDFIIDNEGNIILSAYSRDRTRNYPHIGDHTDYIHIFYLDTLGELVREHNCYVSDYHATPVQIYHEGNSTYVFYQMNNKIFFRKINDEGVSSEYRLDISYQALISRSKKVVNISDSKLWVFGWNNSNKAVTEVDKNTLKTTGNPNFAVYDFPQIMHAVKRNSNEILLSGMASSNRDKLVSYNITALDTNWTRTYSSQAEMRKFIFDKDSSYLYSMGYASGDVLIKKLSPINGKEIWSYYYKGLSNLIDEPLDISFDEHRNQVILTGYQTDSSYNQANKNVFIEIIDTSGAHVKTYIKYGDFAGDNMGICSEVLHDGSIWVGGNLNHSTFGEAGFIFEIDSSYVTSIDQKFTGFSVDPQIMEVYPNPVSEFINVKYTVIKDNSTVNITLNDVRGNVIYSEHIDGQPKGDYLYTIRAEDLKGMYLLNFQLNNIVNTEKVVLY